MTRAVDVAAFYDPYVTCLKRPDVFLCGRTLRGLTSLRFMNDFLVLGGLNKSIQFKFAIYIYIDICVSYEMAEGQAGEKEYLDPDQC